MGVMRMGFNFSGRLHMGLKWNSQPFNDSNFMHTMLISHALGMGLLVVKNEVHAINKNKDEKNPQLGNVS
jgi:hypothetical protein